jgi:uncharacterized protein (TIGR02646 family)
MIQLSSEIKPSETTLAKLAEYQKEIDDLLTFAEQSAKGKLLFSKHNKKGNTTFDAIKISLDLMCSGARRCCYCEDSQADEVEHIYPKNIYPNLVFSWKNYLYACGICNGPKSDKFAVFRYSDGVFENVQPTRNVPITKPMDGETVLINPRTENPLDFLWLDLSGTFQFTELSEDEETKDFIRAKYTLETLGLRRDILTKARKEAFGDYKARLRAYIHGKEKGISSATLDVMVEEIKTKQHPTVWAEMKRQHKLFPELNRLFEEAPEALVW